MVDNDKAVCDENGEHQSPIYVGLTEQYPAGEFKPFPEPDKMQGFLNTAIIYNNGHTVQIIMDQNETDQPDQKRPILKNFPIDGKDYKFAQIHFHWGQDDKSGSEHKIGDPK